MIGCDFFGGLGNNLFQLATVYNIHKKHGFDLVIPNNPYRINPEHYGIPKNLEILELLDNNFNYVDNINTIPFRNVYRCHDNDLNSTDYRFVEPPIIDYTKYVGYFQSYKYFSETDITNEFLLNKNLVKKIKEKYSDLFSKQTISLHCRLAGDRIENHIQHFHKTVSIEYYEKALSIITEDLSDFNVLVVSDNIKLSQEIFGGRKNFSYITDSKSNIEDFITMSLCDRNIVSNSTFSWWASYLNKNKNKKVVCTETEWFGPGYKHFNLKDTFPPEWIRL